jgi:uncharacterized protein
MCICYFAADLHGKTDRYQKLFNKIIQHKPGAVFLGGDLLPHSHKPGGYHDFIMDFLFVNFSHLKEKLGEEYPAIFIILGNDDPRVEEKHMIDGDALGYWTYLNTQWLNFKEYSVIGYPFVPPTPFRLKDWEKYDVSRYVDPGCIHPTEGFRTIDTVEDIEYTTIEKDLEKLTPGFDFSKTICLFHSPPYQTLLDRAALDGIKVEGVPMDVHVGSIAIKRFIETKQPRVTLHGHIHESSSITGHWKQQIGQTWCFSAAYQEHELALVIFDLAKITEAKRILL